MDRANRPKTSTVRTSLVDSEWESADDVLGKPEPSTDPAIVDGDRPELATMQLEDDELHAVAIGADRLRQLTAYDASASDKDTEVMSVGRRAQLRISTAEADIDSLLASEEERHLPPRPGSVPDVRVPPPTEHTPARAPSGRPPLPTPPSVPLPAFDRSELELPVPDVAAGPLPPPNLPAFDAPELERSVPDVEVRPLPPPNIAAFSPTAGETLGRPPELPREPPPRQLERGFVGRARQRLLDLWSESGLASLGRRPRRLVLGAAVGALVLVGTVLAALLAGKSDTPAETAGIEEPVEPEAVVRNEAQESPAATKTEERSGPDQGELDALARLKEKAMAERTAAETMALATGRSREKAMALEALIAEIRKNPAVLTENADQRARLKDFFYDRETTNLTARAILELPSPLSQDLFYELWTGTKRRDESTILAEELVHAKDVRENASDALRIALDLREVEDCEAAKTLVSRAIEVADKRSTHLLGRLTRTTGCGPKKRDDCWPCLRELEDTEGSPSLTAAIRASAERAGPRL